MVRFRQFAQYVILSSSAFILNACGQDDDKEESPVILSINNLTDTTGMVSITLDDSVVLEGDVTSYSLSVTDGESAESVLFRDDSDISTLDSGISFSPYSLNSVPAQMPRARQIQRTFEIELRLQYTDGTISTTKEVWSFDKTVAIGNVSGAFSPTASSNACKAICSDHGVDLISCVFPTDNACHVAILRSASGANDLISAANAVASEYSFETVDGTTAMWLQAAGGYGGRNKPKDGGRSHGGDGGFSQSVTTISDIESDQTKDAVLYYYVANTGSHGRSGSGGPSTIVTTQEITAPFNTDADPLSGLPILVLVAGGGGGGGGGKSGSTVKGRKGGRGAIAISTGDAATGTGERGSGKAFGDSSHSGGYGGGAIYENDVLVRAKGGERIQHGEQGRDGIGGNSGHEVGWINAPGLASILGINGQGGQPKNDSSLGGSSGGGGGGFGGGSSGDAADGAGGGGGGGYARANTFADSRAPTEIADVKSGTEGFRSSGWFRVVFNAERKKQ